MVILKGLIIMNYYDNIKEKLINNEIVKHL